MSDYDTTSTTNGNSIMRIEDIITSAEANFGSRSISGKLKQQKGVTPRLYFKYIKSKLSFLEKRKVDARIKKLEKAFYAAIDSGQNALGEKILRNMAVETKQTLMFAKGIKMFIEKGDLDAKKYKIQGGHISDTKFEDYTRVIPKRILKEKKRVEECFDGFVIYHYYNKQAIKDMEEKGEVMDKKEKENMKDPVLFGFIKENNRLYFIDEWDDEFCDLTFDELVDHIGKDEKELTIKREPQL